MKKNILIWLTFTNLMITTNTSLATVLESPENGATLSGIGFISGWKCHATNITISIDDGEHLPVAMNQERGDLLIRNNCGDGTIHHGFIMQINWALLGRGEHIVKAYDNGVEFDRAVFIIGTIDGEEFLKGKTREEYIDGFPNPGQQTLLQWNQSTQHFEVVYVEGTKLTDNYDEAYWKEYKADQQWNPELLYAVEPDVDNCQEGRLSQQAKNRALESINQIRKLHGLAPLRYSSIYDNQAQKASLIQEANDFTDHHPNPNVKCYTKEGDEGSNTNISRGFDNRDPAISSVRLTNDAYNVGLIPAVAHRRWLLSPFVTYFTYGQVRSYAILKTSGFTREPEVSPQIKVNFIAFPYKTYPFYLLHPGDPPWSFSVVIDKRDLWGNQGDFFKNASITVTRVSDGTQLAISNRYTDSLGYGFPNLLSWNVEDWEFDTLYEVEIKNVTLKDRTTQNYSYPVFVQKQNL